MRVFLRPRALLPLRESVNFSAETFLVHAGHADDAANKRGGGDGVHAGFCPPYGCAQPGPHCEHLLCSRT